MNKQLTVRLTPMGMPVAETMGQQRDEKSI